MRFIPSQRINYLKKSVLALSGFLCLQLFLGTMSSSVLAGQDRIPSAGQETPPEILTALSSAVQPSGGPAPAENGGPSKTNFCPAGVLKGSPGKRQVVLLVGVGTHQNPELPQPPGPGLDTMRMRKALIHSGTGGIPARNVCVLKDSDATLKNLKEVWQKDVVERVSPGDSVLLYLSGIGSHSRDVGGDEPDEYDETFLMYESRYKGQPDLSDDFLASMLREIHTKVANITLILDTSGAGAAVPQGISARSVPPEVQDTQTLQVSDTDPLKKGDIETLRVSDTDPLKKGDGEGSWGARDLPGLVVLSAADHGTLAFGDAHGGLFTSALLESLASTAQPTAIALLPELQRRLSPYGQLPSVTGAVDRPLLRFLPDAWHATGIITQIADSSFSMQSPDLTGWGPGAELLVVPADSSATRPQDAEPLATALITERSGKTFRASLVPLPGAERRPRVGDRIRLFRPSTEEARLVIAPAPAEAAGAVAPQTLKRLERALAGQPGLARIVHLSGSGASLALRQRPDQALELVGPEGQVRVVVPAGTGQTTALLNTLRGFAFQRALRLAVSTSGADLNDRLTLVLNPPTNTDGCPGKRSWNNKGSSLAARPQCGSNVEFGLAANATGTRFGLLLVLEPDGRIDPSSGFGLAKTLKPGELRQKTLPTLPEQTVGSMGQLVFLSTPEDDPIFWSINAQDKAPPGPNDMALDAQFWRFLLGTREEKWQERGGALRQVSGMELLSWRGVRIPPATSTLPLQNLRGFSEAGLLVGVSPGARQQQSASPALKHLFSELEALTSQAPKLGHHDWLQLTETANLALGINNPRAIWHLFRRSGVPYNGGDRFVTTSGMTGEDSELAREFARCDASPELRAGDLLVWRDRDRSIGQAALVIDPLERVVWGGLELDGTREEERTDQPALGYFTLRYQQDWEALGLPGMQRVACWRHRQFMDVQP